MKFFKDFSCQPERSATSLGAIAVGKADIVVVDGNPVEKISDIGKVETVFKDGIGTGRVKLRAIVQGLSGIR